MQHHVIKMWVEGNRALSILIVELDETKQTHAQCGHNQCPLGKTLVGVYSSLDVVTEKPMPLLETEPEVSSPWPVTLLTQVACR